MKIDVLLTDGGYKHTYAMVRALNEKGLKVGVLFNSYFSLSYCSVKVSKKIKVDSKIYNNEKVYMSELLKILKENDIQVLMPVGNISNSIISKNKEKLTSLTKVLIADYEIMKIAQFKNETFEFAENIGIPIPKTYIPSNKIELDSIINKVEYPCVIKKVNPDESGVVYCNNQTELKKHFEDLIENKETNYKFPIIQEYVKGVGTGYYALFSEGNCLASFMHKRIHEFPITGGSSTCAKSIENNKLKLLGDKLLSELKWTGIAMVEFKEDSKSRLKLMEINPKFWGSVELSHKSGINFPYLYYLAALGKEVPTSNYKNNIYFEWTFPHDFMWYVFASKKQRIEYKKLKKKVKIYNNIHFDDPLTIVFNLLFTVYKVIKEKKYPHGRIDE